MASKPKESAPPWAGGARDVLSASHKERIIDTLDRGCGAVDARHSSEFRGDLGLDYHHGCIWEHPLGHFAPYFSLDGQHMFRGAVGRPWR